MGTIGTIVLGLILLSFVIDRERTAAVLGQLLGLGLLLGWIMVAFAVFFTLTACGLVTIAEFVGSVIT